MRALVEEKDIQIFTIKWLIYWGLGMGSYLLFLNPFGINHLNKIEITIPYFLLFALGGGIVFNLKDKLNFVEEYRKQFYLILFISLAFFAFPFLVNPIMPMSEGTNAFLMKWKFFYPLFKMETSATKLADVIFQQTLIISLVLFLKEKCRNNKEAIITFTWVFLVLHLPLVFVFKVLSLIFIVPSLFAGIIFSYVIIEKKYGLFYSFLVHLGFYISTGIIFRLIEF